MNVFGKVIDINMSRTINKQGGGSYKGATLTYRDQKDDSIKEKHFHDNVLKFNPSLKSQLSGLVKDADFTMVIEKEGDFWNVKSISNGMVQNTDAGSNQASSVPARVSVAASSNASPKSTYATAEERAQTQLYIVRQSTLTQALTYLSWYKDASDGPIGAEQVIAIAKQFEAHVMGNDYDDGSIENMENDIPY